MKSHISKKHKKEEEVDKYIYPKQCDLGDFICNNSKELRKHMRTHSYRHATYKCAMCEFVGGEEIDMEVHNAKMHSDKFDCGLCEFEGKDFETLDIHLTTCECYICGLCEEKFKQISTVKEHFGTKHKESKTSSFYGVRHFKPSRQNKEVYDQTFHYIEALFPELNS